MTIKTMKNVKFKRADEKTWEKEAERLLRGTSLTNISKNTYEQIQLKPLYTQQTTGKFNSYNSYPGFVDFRRGVNLLGYKLTPWKIAQQLTATTPTELKEKLTKAIKNGQTAIAFQLNDKLLHDYDTLAMIVSQHCSRYPFSLNIQLNQAKFYDTLGQIKQQYELTNSDFTGFVAIDPLAQLIEQGGLQDNLETTYDKWANILETTNKKFPNLRTINVNTLIYNNSGANAVQQLAIALLVAVHHIEQLRKRNIPLDEIFSKIIFQFGVGANFFMEIAKLRAAKLLWSKIGEAYGVNNENRQMHIAAQTAKFTKTVADEHVNIIRAANEAFAAVLGGVQFLHVDNFNETFQKPSELAERIARNTQLILREEALLSEVIDPAGGSWYLESLTDELAHRSWELFLKIDEQGGIVEVIKDGTIQSEILKVSEQRKTDLYKRKRTIVGVNKYVDLSKKLNLIEKSTLEENDEILVEKVTSLLDIRLANPFEELRVKGEQLNATVGAVCLGKLKDYKQRVDFLTDFLAAGGIKVIELQFTNNVSKLTTFVKENNLKQIIFCGCDNSYNSFPKNIIENIHREIADISVFIVGTFTIEEKDAWSTVGISQFINSESDCFKITSSLLEELEGAKIVKEAEF